MCPFVPLNLSFFGGGRGGFRGGRQRPRRQMGNTPRNNRVQNRQFDDAVRQLNLDQRQELHRVIGRQGFGFWEMVETGRAMFGSN